VRIFLFVLSVALACSSAPRYPACDRDEQCAVSGKHDYCVATAAGRTCSYCRTSADCADRERCRVGKCEVDPDAPPPKALDAGDDAECDAGEWDDCGAPAEEAGTKEDDNAPAESPRHVLPQGIRRYFHP
jgi:hypothetical protein